MTTPTAPTLVFLDTETTGLRPDRRAWDIALIVRRPDRPDVEHQWFVQAEDLDLGNADPYGLRVGRFYDRHPEIDGNPVDHPAWADVHPEFDVLAQVEFATRGAHLVGCVPNFDTDVLDTRMRANGILPSWHYHLIDVETLAVGWLAGRGRPLPGLPWDSEALSAAVGVEPASADDRHTALGDARWARDIYDAVMGGQAAAS